MILDSYESPTRGLSYAVPFVSKFGVFYDKYENFRVRGQSSPRRAKQRLAGLLRLIRRIVLLRWHAETAALLFVDHGSCVLCTSLSAQRARGGRRGPARRARPCLCRQRSKDASAGCWKC